MGLFEAVGSVFSHYADFNGRARRSEYWFFCLFNMLVFVFYLLLTFIVGLISAMVGFDPEMFPLPIMILSSLISLYYLAAIIPGLAVYIRRLHDIGKSGWHIFLALIPLVGAIVLLVFVCKDSEPGENRYGSNPKEERVYDCYIRRVTRGGGTCSPARYNKG